ncbi:hypothetical protein HDV03_000749 [Kappamyces sp. JEL0829]|nr:hypothetical protein HDV03_000749 [Kappamyces sp. JEL0829]
MVKALSKSLLAPRGMATGTKTVSMLAATSGAVRPYKHESSLSLLNSLAVFQMCGIPPLVNNVPTFIRLAKATGTSPILHAVVKQTFFRHFCGGEDLKEVLPTMDKLAKAQVGSILDLAIEADLDAANLTGAAAQNQTRQMVDSLKQCIDIASHQPESFIAVKVTALAPPSLLQTWSATLDRLYAAFTALADPDGNVDVVQFQKLAATFPGLSKLNMEQLFRANDLDKSGKLSYSDVTAIFSLFSIDNCRALVDGSVPNSLTNQDLDTAALVIKEIRVLCDYAQSQKVKLMMDAEQTYFQPAIDDVVIGLCRNYNAKLGARGDWSGPLVFNTYQMYLTSSLRRLKADVFRAQQKGYSFGIKIVRGAYMVSERERAMRLGYVSPIHPDIEATHKAYNDGVSFIIEQQALHTKSADSVVGLSLVVASHNHASVELTCSLMEKHGIPRSGGWVSFGQLLGMQDGLTHSVASNGFKALKYVPYGPVEVAIPYLHRRAQENQAMMAAMEKDKTAIKTEIKTRLGFH